jgi:hypothetical protein
MNIGGKRRNEQMYSDMALRAGLRARSISRDEISDSAVIEMVPV